MVMFRSVAGLLPRRDYPSCALSGRQIAIVCLAPTVAIPLIAGAVNLNILPVLVAEYLGLHLLSFGGIRLVLLRIWGVALGRTTWASLLALLVWCILFGVVLDRYATNFWPTAQRVWIIVVRMLGAVPYMLADAVLTTDASFCGVLACASVYWCHLAMPWRWILRGCFFLIMIAPVLVLFYLVFGTIGRHASRKGGPVSSGIALGIVLAGALGVSFPLCSTHAGRVARSTERHVSSVITIKTTAINHSFMWRLTSL